MQIYKGIVQEGGSIVIPASIRKEFTLEPGSGFVFIIESGNLSIRSRQQVLEEAQKFFMENTPNTGSIVDELIAERREEATREAKHD